MSEQMMTLEDVLAEPLGGPQIEQAAAWSLDDPVAYMQLLAALAERMKSRELDDYKRGVRAVVKLLKAERTREQAERRREAAQARMESGEICATFKLGSNAEVARTLFASLTSREGVAPAYGYGDLHTYNDDNGLWVRRGERELSCLVQRYDGSPILPELGTQGVYPGTLKINSTGSVVSLACDLPEEFGQGAEWLEDAGRGLAFADCHLMLEDNAGEVQLVERPHDPAHRLRVGYDFDLPDPGEPCPMFEAYLEGVWGECSDGPERIELLQEFAGAALVGLAPRFGRALLLHGKPGTGKGTMLKILEALYPEGGVTTVPPHDWGNDSLVGALKVSKLNLVYELAYDRPLKDIARIKQIIFGERIQYHILYVPEPASLRCQAGHIFATNGMPRVYNSDPAIWDRWMVLEMGNKTWRNTDEEIKDLDQRIIEAEQPGVVAWALEGARRLMRRGRYTLPESSRRALKQWSAEAEPFTEWLAAQTVEEDGAWTRLADLYKDYCDWCQDNGNEALGKGNFSKKLRQHFDATPRNSGLGFVGVRLVGAAPGGAF